MFPRINDLWCSSIFYLVFVVSLTPSDQTVTCAIDSHCEARCLFSIDLPGCRMEAYCRPVGKPGPCRVSGRAHMHVRAQDFGLSFHTKDQDLMMSLNLIL